MTRFRLRTVLCAAALSVGATAAVIAQTAEERVGNLEKRLSIAEREADLAKRRLADLQREMNELGPYLEEARYNKLVDEIARQVSEIRKLPLEKAIKPIILDRDGLKELLDRLIKQELTPKAEEGLSATWKTLELLPPDADLKLLYSSLLEEQVGGLYNERDGSLYVVSTFDPKSLIGRVILAHEICHALQDQNHPIRDLPFRTDNEDQNMATAAVIEGDATFLMIEWGAESFAASDLFSMTEIFEQSTQQLDSVPPALVQMLVFPYLAGMEFMTQVIVDGGMGSRDDPFENPPLSTEQILHPEKYLGRKDVPVAVALPEWTERDGMHEVMRTPAGEWMTRLVLTHSDAFPELRMTTTEFLVTDPQAVDGAAGWGGDLVSTVRSADGAREFLAWKSVWDTERDAAEFRDALVDRMLRWNKFAGLDPVVNGDTATFSREGGWQATVRTDGEWVLVLVATTESELAVAEEWLSLK